MFLTTPVPFDEAAKAIQHLAPVDAETFANLLPELRDAAMTISGVEGLDVVVRVREIIARLPKGADFDTLKGEIEEELSPWLNPKAAEKRATLLLRLHGFRAYAAAAHRQMEAHTGAFPYRQYVATMDEKTRHSHRALHGVVLPAGHPFWTNHTGPWAWGCRCEAVPLTKGAKERIEAADANRLPEAALVLKDGLLKQLENGQIMRGPTMIFDVRTTREKTGDAGDFEWRPGDASLPLAQVKAGYTPAEWAHFETWAKRRTTGDGRNLWDTLTAGRPGAAPVRKRREPVPPLPPARPVPPAPPVPPVPATTGTPRTRAGLEKTLAELAGEEARYNEEYQKARTAGDAEEMLAAMKKRIAVEERFRAACVIPEAERGTFAVEAAPRDMLGKRRGEAVERKAPTPELMALAARGAEIVRQWTNADLLRPVRVIAWEGRACYLPGENAICVNTGTFASVVAHEMIHGIEWHRPEIIQASRDFLANRTKGNRLERLRTMTGHKGYGIKEIAFRDKWAERGGSHYCGRLYSTTLKAEDAYATELLTMGIERINAEPLRFLQADPEYFWFVLTTLQKLK